MHNMIPYIFPLMLGRTIDLNKMKVGVDIFPKDVIDSSRIYNLASTSSHYGLVNYPSDAKSLLNIDHAFSLRVKAGIVNAGASGEYLTDHFYRRKTVDMTLKTTHMSVMQELPDRAKPIPNWKKYGEALGTHYVKSIVYGGEIITSIRFKTNNTEVKEKIGNPITHRVLDFGGQDEDGYFQNILKSVDSTQIKIFSSLPLSRLPTDMASLKEIINNEFPNALKQFNEERGLPIRVELRSLRDIDPTIFKQEDSLLNMDLDGKLERFEDRLDDLKQTKAAISDWMKSMVKPLTVKQEQKVGDLYNKVESTLKVFHEVIGALKLSQGPDQLQKAIDAYGAYSEDGFVYTGFEFYEHYLNLRRVMDQEQEEEA